MNDWHLDPPEEPEPPEWMMEIETAIEEATGSANDAKELVEKGFKHDNRPGAMTDAIKNLAESNRNLCRSIEVLMQKYCDLDNRLNSPEPMEEPSFGGVDERDFEEVTECPHGNDPSECDACFHLSDIAFDVAREARVFGR